MLPLRPEEKGEEEEGVPPVQLYLKTAADKSRRARVRVQLRTRDKRSGATNEEAARSVALFSESLEQTEETVTLELCK